MDGRPKTLKVVPLAGALLAVGGIASILACAGLNAIAGSENWAIPIEHDILHAAVLMVVALIAFRVALRKALLPRLCDLNHRICAIFPLGNGDDDGLGSPRDLEGLTASMEHRLAMHNRNIECASMERTRKLERSGIDSVSS